MSTSENKKTRELLEDLFRGELKDYLIKRFGKHDFDEEIEKTLYWKFRSLCDKETLKERKKIYKQTAFLISLNSTKEGRKYLEEYAKRVKLLCVKYLPKE